MDTASLVTLGQVMRQTADRYNSAQHRTLRPLEDNRETRRWRKHKRRRKGGR